MKSIFIRLMALVCTLVPIAANSQANINSNNGFTYYPEIPSWPPAWQTISVGQYFSMNNFNNNEEYRITVIPDNPQLAQNVQMGVGSVWVTSGTAFTWHTGDSFLISYYLLPSTPVGQTQQIRCQIERKRWPFWDYQTTFFYNISPTCVYNATLTQGANPLTGIDYEVSGNLTVSSSVKPNGGLSEFDAGSSVTLIPGFVTDLSGGGAVSVIIEGCLGAYRTAAPSGQQPQTQKDLMGLHPAKTVDVMIYPNPVQDRLFIKVPFSGAEADLRVEISNVAGVQVYSEQTGTRADKSIGLAFLQSGVYLVRISGEGIHYNGKFVKE